MGIWYKRGANSSEESSLQEGAMSDDGAEDCSNKANYC